MRDAARLSQPYAEARIWPDAALYEAAHILFAARNDDIDAFTAARAQADAVLSKLRVHAEQFGELARLHSACPSAAQGQSRADRP